MASKSDEIKKAWVEWSLDNLNPILFKGALMCKDEKGGYIPMDRRTLANAMYRKDMGLRPSIIDHSFDTLQSIAPDWTEYAHYIGFYDQVWDMRKLKFVSQTSFVYSTQLKLQEKGSKGYAAAQSFLLDLSKGSEELARDYAQAMAPLFMSTRPAGVIWFIGDGANGKSSLLKALYMVFGQFFASMTTSAIEDGRDIPMLRGKLGNVVRESSESRVADTERYKSLGTHEPITVHEFNKQGGITVETDFHTIFNANNIPIFSDKTKGARRRTLTVPFPAHFADNPTFEQDTFTPEFLGGLMSIILEQTVELRKNGNKYDWSQETLDMKQSYDSEVNSAEAYVAHLEQHNIKGFTNYIFLKMDYENWCSSNGMLPLGITMLKRTMMNEVIPTRIAVREEGKTVWRYQWLDNISDELTWLDNGYGIPKPKEEVSTIKLGEDW